MYFWTRALPVKMISMLDCPCLCKRLGGIGLGAGTTAVPMSYQETSVYHCSNCKNKEHSSALVCTNLSKHMGTPSCQGAGNKQTNIITQTCPSMKYLDDCLPGSLQKPGPRKPGIRIAAPHQKERTEVHLHVRLPISVQNSGCP
jgi:hypothetical protein